MSVFILNVKNNIVIHVIAYRIIQRQLTYVRRRLWAEPWCGGVPDSTVPGARTTVIKDAIRVLQSPG